MPWHSRSWTQDHYQSIKFVSQLLNSNYFEKEEFVNSKYLELSFKILFPQFFQRKALKILAIQQRAVKRKPNPN